MFDIAISLAKELSIIIGRIIPVQLLTGSKCLFDITLKGSKISEKGTMPNITAARQGLQDEDISGIDFVRSQYNIADGLPKSVKQATLLEAV